MAFLRAELAEGPRLAVDMLNEGPWFGGFSEKTLRRAQEHLGIRPRRVRDRWYWELPAKMVNGSEA